MLRLVRLFLCVARTFCGFFHDPPQKFPKKFTPLAKLYMQTSHVESRWFHLFKTSLSFRNKTFRNKTMKLPLVLIVVDWHWLWCFISLYAVFTCRLLVVKVTPQNWKLPNNIFETFPECSLPGTVSKNGNKTCKSPFSLKRCDGLILPHLCLITRVVSSVPVTFCGSWKQRLLKQYLKKSW